MKKLKYFIIFGALAVFFISPVEAIETSAVQSVNNQTQGVTAQTEDISLQSQEFSAQDIKNLSQEQIGAMKKTLQENQEALQNILIEKKDALKQAIQERRNIIQERINNKEEFARERIENTKQLMQERRENIREKIEEKRQIIKERLEKVEDERKQRIAEHLYDQINNLNERMSNTFSFILDKIEAVLSRIETRSEKAAENGADVSTVEAAITEAINAISASRAAIEAQSQKVYVFEVNSEETLRLDVGSIRQSLHNDLVEVRRTIVAAREAVRKAAVALARIPRVDEFELEVIEPGLNETNPESSNQVDL